MPEAWDKSVSGRGNGPAEGPEWDRSSVAKEGPERQVSGLERKEHKESQSGGW